MEQKHILELTSSCVSLTIYIINSWVSLTAGYFSLPNNTQSGHHYIGLSLRLGTVNSWVMANIYILEMINQVGQKHETLPGGRTPFQNQEI